MSKTTFTLTEAKKKLEHFCAYQERCHDDVIQKIRLLGIFGKDQDEIIVHLIDHDFLNEERFACSFARGKHRIKYWGYSRIVNELKLRHISQRNITTALNEITTEEYAATLHFIASRCWENSTEKNSLKKRKKSCDYLLRKGFESNLVYEIVKQLENNTP